MSRIKKLVLETSRALTSELSRFARLACPLRRRLAHPLRIGRGPVAALCLAGASLVGLSAWAVFAPADLAIVGRVHAPQFPNGHVGQEVWKDLVASGKNAEAFIRAFEHGDEIFGARFNALDGGGVHVGTGERYTRVPRADLKGPGQWATHVPARVTGPNAAGCLDCHIKPFEDGAGEAVANVHRDPFRAASFDKLINRNTPHLFGQGGLQRLAEEMTDELRGWVTAAIAGCPTVGCSVEVKLTAKGVDFGAVTITRVDPTTLPPNNCSGTDAVVFIDPVDCEAGVTATLTGLRGISRDLVVRPFQWKGAVAFVRDFNRDASSQEIGLQPVEMSGDDVDHDHDGVMNETSIGDQTALAVYIAAQPRPTTKLELDALGLLPTALTSQEKGAIARGEGHFVRLGCASCHTPSFVIADAVFSEPSRNASFRDNERLPAGQDPIARSLDPRFPITFDLTRDLPDNVILAGDGSVRARLGSFEPGPRPGSAIIRPYGDMKRHEMGPRLAEQVDEIGTGASTWLTENLWGVGSTAPYLHDGRATTLTEAILYHGGEAQGPRDRFAALPVEAQRELVAFLDNLVIFVLPDAPASE